MEEQFNVERTDCRNWRKLIRSDLTESRVYRFWSRPLSVACPCRLRRISAKSVSSRPYSSCGGVGSTWAKTKYRPSDLRARSPHPTPDRLDPVKQLLEPLGGCDLPNERLLRGGIWAHELARSGHEVVWWTDNVDHMRKRLRARENVSLRLAP